MTRERAAEVLKQELYYLNGGAMLAQDYHDYEEAINVAISALTQPEQKNEPLTIEELRQMDGEPVWIAFLSPTDVCLNHWRIWQTHEYQACELDAYGKIWMAYRRKP